MERPVLSVSGTPAPAGAAHSAQGDSAHDEILAAAKELEARPAARRAAAEAAAKAAAGGSSDEERDDEATGGDNAEESAAPESEEPAEEAEAAEAEVESTEGEESDADAEIEGEEGDAIHKVMVNGQEVEVSTSELVKGYLRQADYTTKATALAGQRSQFEEAVRTFVSERQQVAERIKPMVDQLRQIIEGQDLAQLAELKQTDPGAYSAAILDRQQKIALHNAAVAEQQRLQREAVEQAIPRERAAFIEAAKKFKPDLNEESFEGYYREIGRFALSQGITPAEWAGVTDHRHVTLIAKAMEYDKATRKVPAVKQRLDALPRAARPGVPKSAAQVQAKERAKQRAQVRQTGSFDEAVRYFEKHLPA